MTPAQRAQAAIRLGLETLPPTARTLADVLCHGQGSYELVAELDALAPRSGGSGDAPFVREALECETVEIRQRYHGYIERQERLVARVAELENTRLPSTLWSRDLHGLSIEAKEKLGRVQPVTVGQAGRIPGVSPSDVTVLLVHAKRASAGSPQ